MKAARYDPDRGTPHPTPFFRPLFLLLLLVFSSNDTTAEVEESIFYIKAPDSGESTNVVITGELAIRLAVLHQSNGTDHHFIASSDIFQYSPIYSFRKNFQKGSGGTSAITLRRDIEPGDYEIAVRSNFTDENGNNVSFFTSIPVEVIRAISLDYVQPPTNGSRWFSLGVTIYYEINHIWIWFRTLDGIEADPIEFELVNVVPGHHVFRTKIRRVPTMRFNPTVGYSLTATLDGRQIPFFDSNIPVTITWDDEVEDDRIFTIPNISNTFFIVILVCFLVAFNYYWYFTPKTGGEQKIRYNGKRDKYHPVSDEAASPDDREKPKTE